MIELMIVVVVVAILAAIAIPNFREQARKGRRADAASQIGSLSLALERWRADNPSYATFPAAQITTANTNSSYYTFAISGATGSAYSLTATAKGAQAGDRCGTLTATASTKPTWSGADCP